MKRWLVVLVLMLLAMSLACSVPGLGGRNTDSGEVVTQEPSGSDEGGAVDDGSLSLDVNAMRNLQSYRTRIVYSWQGDDGTSQAMTLEQSETRNPAARYMVISTDQAGESYTMETIQIGTTSWINFGGSWMRSEDDSTNLEEEFGESFLDQSDFADLSDDEYEYLGRETINGIRTRHYRLILTPAQAAMLMGGGEVTDFKGELWVADQNDLPKVAVRWHVEWTGTMADMEQGRGRVAMDYEVYDINKSFTIEPPDESAAGIASDVPTYPDAQNLFSMPGFASFESADDVATVKAFYEEQLPANGWSLSEDNSSGDMVMFTWTKQARTMSLMITTTDSGGANVLITIEGE